MPFLKRIFLRMGEEDLETFLTLWEKFNKITEEESGVTTDIVKNEEGRYEDRIY